ncbi:MAG TPA: hypothetical protein DIC51_06035, partial [Coxiellaceae bacterium]|nr:hypothetical protein [Coxiellaceae bacterium]
SVFFGCFLDPAVKPRDDKARLMSENKLRPTNLLCVFCYPELRLF